MKTNKNILVVMPVEDEHKKALSRLLFGVMVGLWVSEYDFNDSEISFYRLISDRFSILEHRYPAGKS